MHADDMFDILLLVLWLVFGSASVVWALTTMKSTIVSYETTDKISVEVMSSNIPEEYGYTPEEIMLMSVVADSNQPYPHNIQINNNPIVTFNTNYFKDTTGSINSFWSNNIRAVADKTVKSLEIVEDGSGGVVWKAVIE